METSSYLNAHDHNNAEEDDGEKNRDREERHEHSGREERVAVQRGRERLGECSLPEELHLHIQYIWPVLYAE